MQSAAPAATRWCSRDYLDRFRWPSGEATRSYTILTIKANADMIPLHDRIR